MIPLDKLKSITHLCTHANCPDGITSALIVKDALPHVRVSFMAYNTAELAAFEAEPGMLFIDFTPPRERVAEFVAAGAICLDHHPTAKDIVETFGENGVFGLNEKNECGAWLAYEHVWKPLAEPRRVGVWAPEREKVRHFAALAAIRDTWKKEDPRWEDACQQAAALVFFGPDHFFGMSWGFVEQEIRSVGSVLLAKQLSAAQRSLDESQLIITTKGTEVWMFQGVSTTSDAAELAEKVVEKTLHHQIGPSQPDLIVGFHYRSETCTGCGGGGDNDPSGAQGLDPCCPKCGGSGSRLKLQFSMRSHTGYDCASFAKAHGGGGHTAAAGFTVEVSPEVSVNPYAVFRLLLEEWEAGKQAVTESDLIRALRVVALSNEERMKLLAYEGPATEALWFLEHVDYLAPELHRRGWVEYAEFTHVPGQITVTTGNGDVRAVVATELGRKQLNAAVGA